MDAGLDRVSGTLLDGRYRLGRLVAVGEMSATYEAREVTADPAAGAASVIRLHALWFLDGTEEDRARVVARCAAVLTPVLQMDHRNLAVLRSWGVTDLDASANPRYPVVYTVMDPIPGGTLGELFDRGRRLSPSQAVVIGVEVCRALDYAHRRGCLHTLISPTSIMFDEHGQVRVVDLGIAELLTEQYCAEPSAMPSEVVRYASPELAAGVASVPSSDVYAVSLTLVEGITGEVPFQADSLAASRAARVDRLLPVSADLGPLAVVLERAGRPAAQERSTPSQFGRAMLQLADRLPRPEPLGLAVDPAATQVMPIVAEELAESMDVDSGAHSEAATDAPIVVNDSIDGGDATVPLEVMALVTPREGAATPDLATVQDGRGPSLSPMARGAIGLGVLVLAALITVIAVRIVSVPTAIVPELTGLLRAEAVVLAEEEGWSVEIEILRSDLEPRMGHIVTIVPQAGQRLALAEPLRMVVSAGPGFRILPAIDGTVATEAKRVLESLGLEVIVENVFDEDLPTGGVLSWEVVDQPELIAGDQILPGETVIMQVSLGPEPRVVPDLAGLADGDAAQALENLRLTVVRLDDVFDLVVPVGRVAAQSPAPGVRVARGAVVEIAVSKGPDLIPFPDLRRTDLREAQRLLAEVGLIGVLTFGASDGEFRSATFEDRTLRPGDLLPRGVQVDLAFL